MCVCECIQKEEKANPKRGSSHRCEPKRRMQQKQWQIKRTSRSQPNAAVLKITTTTSTVRFYNECQCFFSFDFVYCRFCLQSVFSHLLQFLSCICSFICLCVCVLMNISASLGCRNILLTHKHKTVRLQNT